MKPTIQQSLDRPAWTQDDLHAYQHRQVQGRVLKRYYDKLYHQLKKITKT